MKRLLLLTLSALALSSTAQAAPCTTSPSQDNANAELVAMNAANTALKAAYYGYAVRYNNINYKVLPGKTTINGNSARVVGNIAVQGTDRSTGKRESNTLHGTVTLVRSGCGWRMTGYKPGG